MDHVDTAPAPELTEFGHLTIAFDDRVLRPRPWTQMQSRWAADLLPDLPAGDVLEVCAGAGHIGLLAVAGTGRALAMVDANEVACAFAVENAARAGQEVEVRHGLMQDVLTTEERFALVIADPPWVPSAETVLHPEDPLLAIDGGPDGLVLVRACLEVAGRHLLPDGAAVLQVGGAAQVAEVERYVDDRPGLGLRVTDHRLAERGALVLLRHR